MKKIYYLFIFLFIVIGCNKDDENSPPSAIEPETFITQGSELISVSENTIILNGDNPNLEINDIIVSGANAKAPRGFLRKIKEINSVDGTLVLKTVRTSIEEGLKYFSTTENTLQATFSHTFTQNDGRIQSNRNFNIVLEIDETITVNGIDLNLNGNLEITPSLSGNIIINRNAIGLPYLKTLELITQTENNFAITLTTETELSFDEEIILGSFQASPITILLGGFPVVVIPEVSLSVGANGQINATLAYSYNSNSTFTAGIRYDENWQFPDSNGLVVNNTTAEATAEVTGEAKIYIKPEFGISLYDEGFVNTGINIKPYARFQGSINTNGYEYGVYGGISAGAFFKASIFGFNLVNKEWDNLITLAEYVIISGTANASTPTVTTAEVSDITNNSAQSGGAVTDDGGSTVTARGICWSTTPNPTTVNNTTNNGSGLGSFISQLSGLEPNTNYYVRAYATNDVGTAYGSQLTFTTQGSGSVSPAYNPNPVNGATNVPLNGTLSFTPGNNTPTNATFKLYFGTNPNPTTSYNLGASTTYNYNNLQENTNYYWKVETIGNNNQVLATSTVWSFKTFAGSGNIFNGNISLFSQEEVNNFGINNYTTVTGHIYITSASGNTPVTDLSPLETISTIGGNLTIKDNNYLETIFGLGIISIGENLEIINNIRLENIGALSLLETVDNDLIIYGSSVQSLNSIAQLTPASLTIRDNDNLQSIPEFNNIQSLYHLEISENEQLTTIDGFINLTELSGGGPFAFDKGLIIIGNSSLQTINAFSNMNTCGNTFIISDNNSLHTITIFSNMNRSVSSMLHIANNDSLTNLDFLNTITNVGGDLSITGNSLLDDLCGISPLVIGGGIGSNYIVSDNLYNPTQQDIIDGNCSL